VIEQQMRETRASLTEKVSALEQQVVGTIETATSAVQGTVETVKETVESVKTAMQDTVATVKEGVHDSMESVTEGVKESLDVRAHVRKNPWLMVGGAAAAGVVVGLLVFRSRRAPAHDISELSSGGSPQYRDLPLERASFAASPPQPSRAAAPPEPRRPGLFDELIGMVSREVKQLGEEALRTATTSLKQTVHDSIPKLVETAAVAVQEQAEGLLHPRQHGPHQGNGSHRFTSYPEGGPTQE